MDYLKRGIKSVHMMANLILPLFFGSPFNIFSELYEILSMYWAGYQFNSSGFGICIWLVRLWVGKPIPL